MRSSKLMLLAIIALIVTQSCSRQKGYFTVVTQQSNAKAVSQKADSNNSIKVVQHEQLEVPHSTSVPLTASSSDNFVVENSEKLAKYEIQVKEALANPAVATAHQNHQTKEVKMNFVQKMIVKKIQKKMAKSAKPVGFQDWSPFLKIGVILLGIGIVLAIFGLGVVGGLAAFIGLIFTILGLLSTV